MLIGVFVLSALGMSLGYLLGFAHRKFSVEEDPLVAEISDLLPNTQCGQCGYAGCQQAAEAAAAGETDATFCPPGGATLAEKLGELLHIDVDTAGMADGPVRALIDGAHCTGCCRCYKVCPTDAIMGATKQIHSVFTEACTGCRLCYNACPEDCISMVGEAVSLDTWHWPKPAVAAGA